MIQIEQQKKTTKTVTQDNVVYLIDFLEKRADIISSNLTKGSTVTIPNSIKYESTNYIIKNILTCAFENSPVKSIQFSEDSQVTIIKNKAFINSKIECITIPPNLTIIEGYAFYKCANLKFFQIPENSKLRSIGNCAFRDTIIESIFIPESLDTLKTQWCMSTPELKKIKVSPKNPYFCCLDENILIKKSSLTNEYDSIIFCNRHIEEVTIPNFIKYIEQLAFNECTHIRSIKFQNDSNLLVIGENAFANSSIKSLTIPKHLKIIDENAFTYCEELYKIEIPEDSELTKICYMALYQTSIESLFIPENLIDLEYGWCTATSYLMDVNIHPNNPKYKKYDDNLIIGKSSIENDCYDSIVFCNRNAINVKIPNFIKIIEDCAFERCFFIQNIEIQENSQLQIIKPFAFDSSSVSKFTFPSHLTQINSFAFNGCIELRRIEFQENSELKLISSNAFNETEIECFSIPPSVEEIEPEVFLKCEYLQIIEIDENSLLSSIDECIFGDCNAIIMIPVNLKSLILH